MNYHIFCLVKKDILFKMSDLNLFNSIVNKPNSDASSNNITYHLLTHDDKPEVKELLLTKCYKVYCNFNLIRHQIIYYISLMI